MILLFLQLAVSAAPPAQLDAIRFEMLVTNEIFGAGLPVRPIVFRQTSVQAGDRVRTDLAGLANRSFVPPGFPSPGSFNIYSGRTLQAITVDTVKREYYVVRLDSAAVLSSTMTKMFMDANMSVSIDTAEVEDLGAGPPMHGHPTRRWRMKQHLTISAEMMGESRRFSMGIDFDVHYAASAELPASSMVSVAPRMMSAFETLLSKEDAERSDQIMAKLPNAFIMRALATTRYRGRGLESGFTLTAEVTRIEKIRVPAEYFELPAGYKEIPAPTRGTN